MAASIALQTTLGRDIITKSAEPQIVYLLLEAMAVDVPARATKLPLNLCLVLDRSSSMRGQRLYQLKEAAQQIVEQLSGQDSFSLISFNDRATVVIQAQRVTNKAELKAEIQTIEAAGGTEMATGLEIGLQELQRTMMGQSVSRMLLLTDGQTYGDEERCLQLTRRAQERGIGLTIFGLGEEWNEDLLQQLANQENSSTRYITSVESIAQVFGQELKRMTSIFAKGVLLSLKFQAASKLRSLDRVQPFLAPLNSKQDRSGQFLARLGDWSSDETQTFLIEVEVPPLAPGEQPLFNLELRYDLPGLNLRDQTSNSPVTIKVQEEALNSQTLNSTVKQWLERLVAYRQQNRAWQDIQAGRVKEGTSRLQVASQRMADVGEHDLAQMMQKEALQLEQTGNTSAGARKRIKYGTRGLVANKPLK